MTVFGVCSISFEPLVGFTNYSTQMQSMMSRCAVLMFDQGQCHSSRFHVVWLLCVRSITKGLWHFEMTWYKCTVPWDDVQAYVWLRSPEGQGDTLRSNSCVHSIYFEPLMWLTNNSEHMSSMITWPYQFKVKVKLQG